MTIHPQSPEQTTPSPTSDKLNNDKSVPKCEHDPLHRIYHGQIDRSQYESCGTCGFVFIQKIIDQAKAEARAEAFDEVIQFIKPISKSYSREHDKTSYEVNRCLVDLMRCIEELKKI